MRLVLPLLVVVFLSFPAAAATLDEAREHVQKGRYEEAIETLGEIDGEAVDVALLHSRALEETGEWDDAAKVVDAALADAVKDVRLRARRAELHLKRGEFDAAEKLANAVIADEPDQLLARWVQAEVLTETGRIPEADVAYRWFVRYYNRAQPEDARSLLHVADGALQYARWHSSSSIFRFVINDLCPDALKDDDQSWQAWHLSGRTLLEKYNRAQALPEFEDALAINARAADVLASIGELDVQKMEFEEALERADAALKVHPAHPRALRLKADVLLQNGKIGEAVVALEKARVVNPRDQRTLARIAACYVLVDGAPTIERLEELLALFGEKADGEIAANTRLERLFAEVAEYNRRPGYFLSELGEVLDGRRKYDHAEVVYRNASRVHDQLSEPQVGLGMLYMRVGRVEEAREILDSAFKADPFHVRVSNTRKVLKVLAEYETVETEHFIVQFDGEKDRVLGEEMAEYLESIYPKYTELYGFEPEGKTRFEIYNEHKGIDGHGWFSARMVGLPWIQTIGATTGMIVAFASPNASPKPYNWAQVCRHEFVHVLTLQRTKFNIPHWFTEALAVGSEGYPRPKEWNDLLLKRVPQRDLKDLSNLTDGFTRPDDLIEWQFAYCQSKLYADYMRAEFGDESIRQLLRAYEANKTTTEAVPEVFGVSVEEFEKGHLEYLDALVERIRGPGAVDGRSDEEIEKAYEADPDDAKSAAAFAKLKYDEREFDEAGEIAEKVLEDVPETPLAAVVVARLKLRAKDTEAALAALEPALDDEAPHREVLELLAKLSLTEGDLDEAARLHELGMKSYPEDPNWITGLAAVRRKQGDEGALRDSLEQLANSDADDPQPRVELARATLDEEDFEAALKWATRAMHITAHDPEVHVLRGRAFLGLDRTADAKQAFERALILDEENDDAKSGLDGIE